MTATRPPAPLDRLHPVEVQAMRLDGELVAIAPAWASAGPGGSAARYAPLDEPLEPARRMGAIAGSVPGGFAVAGGTAAWVYDGLCPGDRLELLALHRRARVGSAGAARVRYARVRFAETTLLAGRRLTTPARTLADLALDGGWPDERLRWFAASLRPDERAGLVIDALAAALLARTGAERARAQLARLEFELGAPAAGRGLVTP